MPSERLRQTGKWLAPAAALLVLYYVMAVTGVLHKSVTFDETAHVAAGYGYDAFNDYRLQPENGNLPQRWIALPVVLGNFKFPELDQPLWHFSDVWGMADQLFYGLGNDADTLLWRARAMVTILGVILGALVFGWARRLFPGAGPWVSLTLFVFCPTMLAHGALATSDMCAALFFTATVGALWIVLHRITPARVALSSLVMAGLFVSKFSAPLIVPIGLVMVAVRLINPAPLLLAWRGKTREITGRLRQLGAFAGLMAVHVFVTWVVIWTCYGFRYTAFEAGTNGEDRFAVDLEAMRETPIPMEGFIKLARNYHLLPESYLYGFAHTLRFAEARSAFLNGVVSNTGRAAFFPYAFLVKSTLPFLLLLIVAVAGAIAHAKAVDPQRPDLRLIHGVYRTMPLWALITVYWAFAITSNLNIGHRHLLPTYPALMILAGAAGFWINRVWAARKEPQAARQRGPAPSPLPKIFAGLTALLLVLHAGASFSIRPDYLAFFNQLVGPENGYKHLVDSSLDWGQDLPGLKSWLDEHDLSGPDPHEPVHLSYFGTGRPGYYKIDATLLPCFFDYRQPQFPAPLRAGYYCISATMLQSVYNLLAQGKWTDAHEQAFQQYRVYLGGDPTTIQNFLRNFSPQEQVAHIQRWEQLRLGRLNAFLRQRKPLAEIGHSILIYRLTDSEVQQVMYGPPPLGH